MAVLSVNPAGGIEINTRHAFGIDVEIDGLVPRLRLVNDENLLVSVRLANEFGWQQWEAWSLEIEQEINETLRWAIESVDLSAPMTVLQILDESKVADLLPDDLEGWIEEEFERKAEAARNQSYRSEEGGRA